MSASTVSELAASYLEQNAEDLVRRWIDWLRQRVGTTTVTALPERALRNHVPPVLASLGEYVRNPIQLAREELLGHLRLHAQIRRDQGYSIQEVLAEFDGLAELVTTRVNDLIDEWDGKASTAEILALSSRLASGLRALSFITVATYAESDDERSRAIASGLEEFTRAVAHELRNPLNTVSLTTGLMARESSEDRRSAHAAVMQAAVSRASSLVDTIQMVAVVEGARSGNRIVTLTEALTHTIEEYGEEARVAGVRIDLQQPIPDMRVEASLVYIILANLIGNAIKYRDDDKDDRWVRITTAAIEEEHDSGFCQLEIADNGIGIPDELRARVMQRGFRAHPSIAQGTGLGLFLVHQAVIGRGGSLDLHSEEGTGTKITVRIRGLQVSRSVPTADDFSMEEHLRIKATETEAAASDDESAT